MDEFWTLRQFSRNLGIDERRIGKALAMLAPQFRGARAVWPVGDGCRAIYADFYEVESPEKLPPRERLDHYKAERERLALAGASARLVPVNAVRSVNEAVLEVVEPGINALAETLTAERPDLEKEVHKALAGVVPTLRATLEDLTDGTPSAA